MADPQKHGAGRKVEHLAGLQIVQAQAGDFLPADVVHLFDHRVGHEVDLLVLACAVEHDLRGAKFAAPVNEGDLGGEARQEQRLFHGRVAAADHRDFFAREEESVAGGTRRHAVTDQRLLARQARAIGPRHRWR